MKRTLVTVVAVVAVVGLGIYLAGLGAIRDDRVVTLEDTNCQESNALILQAQSVPTAQLIPCITDGAKGWIVADEEYSSDGSTVQLNTGDVSGASWTITLTETCTPDPAATERSYPDQQGRYQVVGMESTDAAAKTATDTEWYRFEGGCTTSSVSIPDRFDSQRIFDEMNIGFVFASRDSLNQFVEDDTDGRLTLDPPPTAP